MADTFSYSQLEAEIMPTVHTIIGEGITLTKPGSIKYLLYGPEPSAQSISIKMGRIGELIVKSIVNHSPNLELLKCGVQCIDEETKKKKDIDLIWKDENKKKIFYMEAKGNIDLDSEKLPATIDKIKEILETHIKPNYPEYEIEIGVFNWSVYNREALDKFSHIKRCEAKCIKVYHMGDMLKILNFEWSEESYTSFFRKIGILMQTMFSQRNNYELRDACC